MKSDYLTILSVASMGLAVAAGIAAAQEPDEAGVPPSPEWRLKATYTDPVEVQGKAIDYGQPKAVSGPLMQARRQPTGALTGRIVFLASGHGWAAQTSQWGTGRGITQGMNEDLGNLDQSSIFARYAWNAGATVVALRPVGWQSNEVVVDQDDNAAAPGTRVVYTGSWVNSSGTPFYAKAPDTTGDNYRTTTASTTENATARFIPSIPVAGDYPVYTWILNSSNRTNQLYRVRHAGGITEVRVNHRRVGKGWVWLGTYHFDAGDGGYVEISNLKLAGDTGTATIADAIRFGNGMGSIDRGFGVSGMPREQEAMRYWAQAGVGSPADDTIYDSGTDDTSDNVSTSPRWAAYMNNEADGASTDRVFLSFHSNAGGGRGADGLYNNETLFPGTKTPNQLRLAELLGRETNEDMRQLDSIYFPAYTAWTSKTTHTFARTDYAFGEIRNDTINGEMDATINEVAYHDSADDAAYLKDSLGRRYIARATLQGMIRYFNEFGGGPLAFPPDEPETLRAINATDGTNDVILTWAAPTVQTSVNATTPGNIGGDNPTGYAVYTSVDGKDFGFATTTGNTTSLRLTGLSRGATVYAYVAATNSGGESLPSNIACARVHGGKPEVLIVNGFTRNDNGLTPNQTIPSGYNITGSLARVIPPRINDYSYVVEHGNAVVDSGLAVDFDSCMAISVKNGAVPLAGYKAVLWSLGEESTVDETFDSAEQTSVTNYLNSGGCLFVSGAEIGWDLDSKGTTADQAFFNNALRADYVGDSAGTYAVTAVAGGIFAGNPSLSFDNTNGPSYNAEFPDRITTIGGSSAVLSYSGGSGGTAGVAYTNTSGGKTVVLGFPFETITSSAARAEMMKDVLGYFGLPVPAPVNATQWMIL